MNNTEATCYDCACSILGGTVLDTEPNRQELASDIQQAIEDWFEDNVPQEDEDGPTPAQRFTRLCNR